MKKKSTRIILGILLLTFISGCGNDNKNSAGSVSPGLGFVATSDFPVGNLTSITGTSPTTIEKTILKDKGLHSDSVLKSFGHFVYILQRKGSNSVVVLDSNRPDVPLVNYSVNDPENTDEANPQDMAFVSNDKAYITRYGLNTLLIVNPQTGTHLGTIDLSAFADSDGIPEMDKMVLIGDRLYVSLQRLDNFKASNDSYIVVIDTKTDQVVEASPGNDKIVLESRNPFGGMVFLASTHRIYLSSTGTFFSSFSTADDFGGIEVVNPDTGLSEGILIPDDAFNGGMGNIVILSETVAYATIGDTNFNNFVVPFNLTTQKIDTPLTGISSSYLPSLALDNSGLLYIADQDTTAPGIQVFDTSNNQKIEGPINTGLPPNDILFVKP